VANDTGDEYLAGDHHEPGRSPSSSPSPAPEYERGGETGEGTTKSSRTDPTVAGTNGHDTLSNPTRGEDRPSLCDSGRITSNETAVSPRSHGDESPSVSPDGPAATRNHAGRSRWTSGFAVGAIVLTVLGGVAGAATTYWLSQSQDVRTQQTVGDDQTRQDATTPPVRGEAQGYSNDVLHSSSSARALSLHEIQDAASKGGKLAEDDVAVGEITVDADSGSKQPRVFEQFFITLVGQHFRTVQLTDITARITSAKTPLSGTNLYRSPRAPSVDESIGFDLDSRRLSARVTETDSLTPVLTETNYFDAHQVTLQRDETLTFRVSAVTAHCRCEFVLDVHTSDGQIVTVDDGGKPWKISAFAPDYNEAYTYDLGKGGQIKNCSWRSDCEGH
jgi:hypothetical protein